MAKTFGLMRLRIEYFDQNDRFAALLPREGVVVSKPRCADSAVGAVDCDGFGCG